MNDDILRKLEEIRQLALLGCKDVLNIKDAATITGMSAQYIYKMVEGREIPHYRSKGGKLIYFDKKELNEWMMSVKVKTRKELDTEATTRVALR